MEDSKKDWLTTTAFCFFFGIFGAHNFLVGRNKRGIIQLLTCGGLGFWTLWDLISLTRNTFVDSEGKIIRRPENIKPVYVYGMFAVFIILVIILGKNNEKKSPKSSKEISGTESEEKIESVKEEEESYINYKIVYELRGKRYDNGVKYYVLIDKVNLKNDDFKYDIKRLIQKIVREKGGKISIRFFDNEKTLNLYYKEYGTMELERPLTQKEKGLKSLHHIATFSGELETGVFFNSLDFFPSAFTKTRQVGKYVDSIEFNPDSEVIKKSIEKFSLQEIVNKTDSQILKMFGKPNSSEIHKGYPCNGTSRLRLSSSN